MRTFGIDDDPSIITDERGVSAQVGDYVPAGHNSDGTTEEDGELYLGDGVWGNSESMGL